MLIAIGRARVSPELRAEMVSAATEMTAITRTDNGCESYGFFAGLNDPEEIISLEIWRDRASLDAHLAHSHTQEFLALAARLVVGIATLTVHEVPDTH
jgi:quinol monooxygenase YgiN